MKRIFIVLFLSVLAQSYAQENKAQKLLDEVSRKIASFDAICLDFKYALENPSQNIHQETRGNLILKKDKYVLNYMGTTRIFDGAKIYTIIPENKEVTIEKPDQNEEQMISPSQMLNFYKKGYSYRWDIVQHIKGRKIQYIELKPIKNQSDTQKILLGIDVQAKNIYNLIEIGKNGTKTTLTVTQFKVDPMLSERFKFDAEKYKKEGYYISEF